MFDERAFIKQFEAADAKKMARTLARPTSDQATALRAYLGDSRYERMHSTALQAIAARRGLTTPSKGKVVVIHGIMGAELSHFDALNVRDSQSPNRITVCKPGELTSTTVIHGSASSMRQRLRVHAKQQLKAAQRSKLPRLRAGSDRAALLRKNRKAQVLL